MFCLVRKVAVTDYSCVLSPSAYNMRNTIREDKVAGQLSAADKETIEKAINGATEWLERNQMAEVEEFEHQLKVEGLLRACDVT